MAQSNELLSPDVRALITRQRGILAAAQAAACGLPRETVRMRVSRGLWQRLLPSVYLLQCGPPNPVQRAFAAQVYAGERSIITGPAALRIHGVGDVVSGLWDDIDGWTAWANSTAAVASPANATSRASGSATVAGTGTTHATDAVAVAVSGEPEPITSSVGTLATPTRAAGDSNPLNGNSHPRSPTPRNPRRRPDPGPAADSIYHPIPPLESDFPAWRVHLLVPHGQRRQNIEYVRVSRTTRIPDPVRRYGLRLAPPARAALDACSWCLEAPDEVTADAFVETVVRATVLAGLADLSELEYELDQAPRRHTRSLRDALARARTRERAAATRRLFEGLSRHGPQGLMRHIVIFGERRQIAVAEALWPSRALAVTIDAKPSAVAELTRLGFAVVQISEYELAKNTAAIVERIAGALAARPEATLPQGVALLPIIGQTEPDAAVEAGLPGRVQLALTSMPMLPQWSGLRVRSPAFSGAF